MRRVPLRGLGLLLLVLVLVGLATPAQAHDYLVSSNPEAGSTLSPAPDEVRLDFNTSIGQDFAQVAVVGPDGKAHQVGAPVVDEATVTQAVGALPDGDLTISYRVVSSDGHPIGGTIPFRVSPTPDTTATGSTGGDTGEQPAAESPDESDQASTAPDAADTEPAAATEDTSGPATLTWAIGLVAVAVVGAAGVGLARRRSRSAADI